MEGRGFNHVNNTKSSIRDNPAHEKHRPPAISPTTTSSDTFFAIPSKREFDLQSLHLTSQQFDQIADVYVRLCNESGLIDRHGINLLLMSVFGVLDDSTEPILDDLFSKNNDSSGIPFSRFLTWWCSYLDGSEPNSNTTFGTCSTSTTPTSSTSQFVTPRPVVSNGHSSPSPSSGHTPSHAALITAITNSMQTAAHTPKLQATRSLPERQLRESRETTSNHSTQVDSVNRRHSAGNLHTQASITTSHSTTSTAHPQPKSKPTQYHQAVPQTARIRHTAETSLSHEPPATRTPHTARHHPATTSARPVALGTRKPRASPRCEYPVHNENVHSTHNITDGTNHTTSPQHPEHQECNQASPPAQTANMTPTVSPCDVHMTAVEDTVDYCSPTLPKHFTPRCYHSPPRCEPSMDNMEEAAPTIVTPSIESIADNDEELLFGNGVETEGLQIDFYPTHANGSNTMESFTCTLGGPAETY
eukprot:TRINITY_DN4097_c0_g1_i1.p1 TRINITY_DN4097_c0_g1~~TRINITY_DN4097_c0_g1_i1.p1  ORF type:complete len:474 (+),score=0.21 TRINITY_DN4097_c0_g1_i1:2-1423(+)